MSISTKKTATTCTFTTTLYWDLSPCASNGWITRRAQQVLFLSKFIVVVDEFALTREYRIEEKGNYVAVGTFLPEIEIWNLDIIDVMQPAVVLGGHVKSASGKRSKVVQSSS